MSPIIEISHLVKTFQIKVKGEGLKESFASFISPRYKTVQAVHDISFSVNKGEIVAFIGPNGAGKSTTLKMLSGIMTPTTGTIRIASLDPVKQRKLLAYKIGTVFGQRSQLWYHLPAIDSFNLFSKIYDLDEKEYKKRLSILIERFDIKEFIDQPVRKLSLGQRMRCEFVLALLHKPEILFLDEPTIGLDVTVKKSIRELIKQLNQEEKTTVILTSHDMGDVEQLCKRAVIINHGNVVFDGLIKDIKEKYMRKKIIRLATQNSAVKPKKEGILLKKYKEYGMRLEIDLKKISMKHAIEHLTEHNDIEDITILEEPIEDIIDEMYKQTR